MAEVKNDEELSGLWCTIAIIPMHISCVIYRHSCMKHRLETTKPTLNLRSNKKVHFKKRPMRRYKLYLHSPLARGVKIWDMLTPEMQKATTKVTFK